MLALKKDLLYVPSVLTVELSVVDGTLADGSVVEGTVADDAVVRHCVALGDMTDPILGPWLSKGRGVGVSFGLVGDFLAPSVAYLS